MARDSKGITQFYLPPTHEPYLPLLPSHRASLPFGWYSLRLPTEWWPGWVDLGVWLYTEIDFSLWTLSPIPALTGPGVDYRLPLLIETNALTSTPNHQPISEHSTKIYQIESDLSFTQLKVNIMKY